MTSRTTTTTSATSSSCTTARPCSLRLVAQDGTAVVLDFTPAELRVEVEALGLDDKKLARSWPDGLTRVVPTLDRPGREGEWGVVLRPAR